METICRSAVAAAVEFALLMPPFALALLIMVDISLALFENRTSWGLHEQEGLRGCVRSNDGS